MFARRTAGIVLFLTLVAAFSLPAAAQSDYAQGARAFLQELTDRTIAVLQQKELTPKDRVETFRNLFAKGFDVPNIGKFVAGRAWTKATDPQKTAYLDVFEDVTILTWALRFDKYAGEKLELGKMREEGKAVLIESDIIRPGKSSIRVDWRIEKGGGGYKILDIVAEGTSLAIAQRADYTAVIQQNNGQFDALVKALRDKREKLRQQAKLE